MSYIQTPADKAMYQRMMRAIPGMPRKSRVTLIAKNTNLNLLSVHVRFLNFKENIGNSLTSNQQEIKIAMMIIHRGRFNIQLDKPVTEALQNKAFAGTGKP